METLATGQKIDLDNNDLVVEYPANSSPFSSLQAKVMEGYSAELDTAKTGIVSTHSQTVVNGNAILALFDNAVAGFAQWPENSGQTVASTAVIGKYTFVGDTNMDGKVTPQDLTAIDANLGTTNDLNIAWFYGDTNFDGNTDATDLTGWDAALGLGTGTGANLDLFPLGDVPLKTLHVNVSSVGPALYVGPFDAGTNKVQLASYGSGNSTVSGWHIDWGDGTTPSVVGSVSEAEHSYATPGVYTIDSGATYGGSTWAAGPVQIAVDQFDGRSALGSNWSVQQGQFTVTGDHVVSAAGSNTATFSGLSAADVSVQAQYDFTANLTFNQAGLVARYNHPASGNTTFYRAILHKYTSQPYWYARIEKQTSGSAIPIVEEEIGSKITSPTGTIRFDVVGNSLGLYINGKLMASCVDNAISSAGLAGIYQNGVGNALDSFAATKVNSTAAAAQFPYEDDFNRPISPSLGSAWTTPNGNNIFVIDGNSAAAFPRGGPALATLNGISQNDVSVSADFDVSSLPLDSRSDPGVVARYTSAAGYYVGSISVWPAANFYRVGIYRKTGSQPLATLISKDVPATRTGRLRLEVVGNWLGLYLNDAPVAEALDPNPPLGAGSVGIFGEYSKNIKLDNFSTTSASTLNAPTGVLATHITSYSATLSWVPVSTATSYRIERKLASEGENAWQTAATVSTPTTTVSGFIYDSSYDVRVRALHQGAESVPSDPLLITTLSPVALTATAISATSIKLRWNSNGNETQFVLESSSSGNAENGSFSTKVVLPAGTTTWTDATLSAYQTRYYRIKATLTDGTTQYSTFAGARALSPGQHFAARGVTTSAGPSGASGDTAGLYRVTITGRGNGDEGNSGATGDLTVGNGGFTNAESPEEAVRAAIKGVLFVPENFAFFAFPDFPYLIGPFTDQGDGTFTGHVKLDNDYNDWEDWDWAVKVERAEVNSLTASADAGGTQSVTSTSPDDGDEINIAQAADGGAAIEVTGTIRPDAPEVQAKALWKITAGGEEIDTGLITPVFSHVNLDPANQGLDYNLTAGIDVNNNSILDDDEITQQIDVHVISLESLTVKDSTNPARTATDNDNPPGSVPHLYIPLQQDDTASIDLSAVIAPDTADAKDRIVWEVDDADGGWIDSDTLGSRWVRLTQTVSCGDHHV